MKYFYTFFFIITLACSPKTIQKSEIFKGDTFLSDTLKYVILPLEFNKHRIDSNAKSFNMNYNDIRIADSLLMNFVNFYNEIEIENYKNVKLKYPNDEINKDNFIINIDRYKKQYLPYIDINNEKIVLLNCFCQLYGNNDWKKYIVSVFDGGNCYFYVLINLTQNKQLAFNVNDSP